MMKWNEFKNKASSSDNSYNSMESTDDVLSVPEIRSEPQKVPQVNEQVIAFEEPSDPGELKIEVLQDNLAGSLAIIDREVLKGYVPHICEMQLSESKTGKKMHFFRISELVYEKGEFAVHKLSSVFGTLSAKPCTVALMIRSDGNKNDFYLGVGPRNANDSISTMRELLKKSFEGTFSGSITKDFGGSELNETISEIKANSHAVSSVTCVADYKKSDKSNISNDDYIQGLEKFVRSMTGEKYTAVIIADSISRNDLSEIRREYEGIYSRISPFADMQLTFGASESTSEGNSSSEGSTTNKSYGVQHGVTSAHTDSVGTSHTTTDESSVTDTTSQSNGTTDTVGHSDSEFTAKTVSVGLNGGFNQVATATAGISTGKSHGTSSAESTAHAVSNTMSKGTSVSKNHSVSMGTSKGTSDTQGTSDSYSYSMGEALNIMKGNSFSVSQGSSRNITMNAKNMTLRSVMDRLQKQFNRISECESIGMWKCAAYFIGDNISSEMAASVYHSLISGNNSGIEYSGVNTWKEQSEDADKIIERVLDFSHPEFSYTNGGRTITVDAAAFVSTNELAIHMGLPRHSVRGLPVVTHAAFAREMIPADHNRYNENTVSSIQIGNVYHLGRKTKDMLNLDKNSLAMHTFVTGSTGSGKSNTIYTILDKLRSDSVKFLVVEPAKGEYKNVFGNIRDVSVYGTNPKLMPLLRLNPFRFPENIHVLEHIDRLVEIFNVCWPMYAAMPAVLKDAVERAYEAAGWDLSSSENPFCSTLYPTFTDVLIQLNNVVDSSAFSQEVKDNYKGSLITRIKSLTNGIYGQIFGNDELGDELLFDNNAIVDLSRVGSVETKSLIMGILVMRLQEYRMTSGEMNSEIRHVTVLEEAHNLLKRTESTGNSESGNLVGKSVEMLSNAIAEMRTYGEGFIIADQAPGLLDMSVIRNTNTKIIMRLPDESDRELVGKAANLNDEQIKELSRLPTGVAAVFQNNWLEAVLCSVEYKKNANIYSNRQNSDRISSESPETAVLRNVLLKLSDEALDKNISELRELASRMNAPSDVKLNAIRALERNGRITEKDISSFVYDMVCTPELEIKAHEAESIEEWKDIFTLFGKIDLSGMSEKAVLDCIILEQHKRFGQPLENMDKLHEFLRESEADMIEESEAAKHIG